MTGSDLITLSMKQLGVLAAGESASNEEATDALMILNMMIDSWSTQSLLIPNKVRDVLALVANTQTYTLGTGGTWNTARPQLIEEAYIQLTSTSPALELAMDVLTTEQYADILLKTTTSTFPRYLYSDNAYPLATVSVWPVPTAVNNIVLYSWKPLTTLSLLTTSLSVPLGYERAMMWNLAIDLAPMFNKQISDILAVKAAESLADIKRMNSKPLYLSCDAALVPAPAIFNWLTGDQA